MIREFLGWNEYKVEGAVDEPARARPCLSAHSTREAKAP